MNKRARTVWISVAALVAVYVLFKGVVALTLAGGLGGAKTVSAGPKAARDFGPYPLNLEPMPPDGEVTWYNPAKAVKRVQEAKQAPVALMNQMAKEQDGDVEKVAMALATRGGEPDSAQALLRLMRDLAPRGSEQAAREAEKEDAEIQKAEGLLREATDQEEKKSAQSKLKAVKQLRAKTKAERERPPLIAMPEGEPGIRVVARVADKLRSRSGKPEEARFEGMLLEEATRLMGFYGAPEVAEGQKQPLANGKGKAAPIDPVVKGVLRTLLRDEDVLQALASRALGQLGDLETAKDLIENPKKYPAASISDFGPEAVEQFKQSQMAKLGKGGSLGEDFWHGARLSYRDRDAAYELAKAGHGGAALANQRHLAMEYANSNPDERLSAYLDTMLRFPGTPAAGRARNAAMGDMGGIHDAIYDGPSLYPKSTQLILRIFDHDMTIVFGDKPWKDDDFIFSGGTSHLIACLHLRQYQPREYARLGYDKIYPVYEALFRKHFKARVTPVLDANAKGTLSRCSLYARHLGLPKIEWPGKEDERKQHSWRFKLGKQKWDEEIRENPDGSPRYKTPQEYLSAEFHSS